MSTPGCPGDCPDRNRVSVRPKNDSPSHVGRLQIIVGQGIAQCLSLHVPKTATSVAVTDKALPQVATALNAGGVRHGCYLVMTVVQTAKTLCRSALETKDITSYVEDALGNDLERICQCTRAAWLDWWYVILLAVRVVQDNRTCAVDISLQLLLSCLAICGRQCSDVRGRKVQCLLRSQHQAQKIRLTFD